MGNTMMVECKTNAQIDILNQYFKDNDCEYFVDSEMSALKDVLEKARENKVADAILVGFQDGELAVSIFYKDQTDYITFDTFVEVVCDGKIGL